MKATSRTEAFWKADMLFPGDYEKDEKASANAGYTILRGTRCPQSWISDLGTRLEVNVVNDEETKTFTIWIEDDNAVDPTEAKLLKYLQSQMDDFQKDLERYGFDEYVEEKMDAMIACKEMAEAIIGKPVNLRKDGKVTIGL